MIVDRLGSHAPTSQSFAGERARAIPNAATLSGHGRGEAGRGQRSSLLATLTEKVIAPAEAKVKALEERRRMIEAELTQPQSASAFPSEEQPRS